MRILAIALIVLFFASCEKANEKSIVLFDVEITPQKLIEWNKYLDSLESNATVSRYESTLQTKAIQIKFKSGKLQNELQFIRQNPSVESVINSFVTIESIDTIVLKVGHQFYQKLDIKLIRYLNVDFDSIAKYKNTWKIDYKRNDNEDDTNYGEEWLAAYFILDEFKSELLHPSLVDLINYKNKYLQNVPLYRDEAYWCNRLKENKNMRAQHELQTFLASTIPQYNVEWSKDTSILNKRNREFQKKVDSIEKTLYKRKDFEKLCKNVIQEAYKAGLIYDLVPYIEKYTSADTMYHIIRLNANIPFCGYSTNDVIHKKNYFKYALACNDYKMANLLLFDLIDNNRRILRYKESVNKDFNALKVLERELHLDIFKIFIAKHIQYRTNTYSHITCYYYVHKDCSYFPYFVSAFKRNKKWLYNLKNQSIDDLNRSNMIQIIDNFENCSNNDK